MSDILVNGEIVNYVKPTISYDDIIKIVGFDDLTINVKKAHQDYRDKGVILIQGGDCILAENDLIITAVRK